jgi:hypothetical protein
MLRGADGSGRLSPRASDVQVQIRMSITIDLSSKVGTLWTVTNRRLLGFLNVTHRAIPIQTQESIPVNEQRVCDRQVFRRYREQPVWVNCCDLTIGMRPKMGFGRSDKPAFVTQLKQAFGVLDPSLKDCCKRPPMPVSCHVGVYGLR